MMDNRDTNSTQHRVVIVLFLVVLWTPFLGMLIGRGRPTTPGENRQMAKLAPWNFTNYFHDHFGLRGSLIILQALLKVKVLGVSSSPEVVVGKNGWLYLAGDYSLDNYRGVHPFRGDELAQWIDLFRTRQTWLERRGVPFAVVIAPDKHTIYPENLPDNVGTAGPPSRLDQLSAALPHVHLIDLRPALMKAKSSAAHPLYYLTDTHWNGYGALAAYQQIARELALPPIPKSECVDSEAIRPGDLAMMLGLRRQIQERMFSCNLRPVPDPKAAAPRRLLMFADSFGGSLMPLFSRNFTSSTFIQSLSFDPTLIETKQPDLVIAELVERRLNTPPPIDPALK